MKYFILFLLSISFADAFTLNNNFGASFKKSKVKVYVAGDSTCVNMAITQAEIEDLVAPAVDNFWNEVPTSKLRLKPSGFSSPISTVDITLARLCSPTDSACISDATTKGQQIIPPVEGIVISCNQQADNFAGSSVLAVTVPNSFSGKKIRGAVILINDTNSANNFASQSRSDQIGIIAHEIGHAIGLGHADESETEALMYFRVVNQRTSLGEDDIKGVTYLYPVKIDGCGLVDSLVGATIVTKNHDDSDDDQNGGGAPFWQMGLGFVLLLILAEGLKLLKGAQTRSAF
jgi:hypothetical protein